MDNQRIISVLEDLVYEDTNNEEYWKAIKEAKALIKELKQALSLGDIVERSEQLPCNHSWKSRFNEKRGSYVICSKCSEER